MSKLSIGIEACGKSLTVLAAADESGQIRAAKRYSTRLNFHEGTRTGLGGLIYGLLKDSLSDCNVDVTEFCRRKGSVVAGISGVTTKYDRMVGIREVWQAAGLSSVEPITTGGIEIAFTGATRTLVGAALACHVGSAALARTDKVIRRVGGWGPLIGDEGSAYWIGTRALNALFRIRDERLIIKTTLAQRIQEKLAGIPTWSDTLRQHSKVKRSNWIDALILLTQRTRDTKEYRYIVSDVATAVFETSEQNPADPIAAAILNDASDELVNQVITAMRRANLEDSPIPVVLYGGVFRYNESFCRIVGERLSKQRPNIQIVAPSDKGFMRPVIGALLFALSGSMFKLPGSSVIQNVELSMKRFEELGDY